MKQFFLNSNLPIMYHKFLHCKESLVSDIRIFVPEKLHHALFSAKLFNYAKINGTVFYN